MQIKNIIYDTLEKENKQYLPKNHNPSSASFMFANGKVIGKDLLSQYLRWNGIKPTNPPGPGALLRMKLGDGTHNILSQILSKAGIKSMSEVSGVSTIPELTHPIGYRVDDLHEIDGELEVLEIKSGTDQNMFGKGWGIEDKGPKEEHLLQVICYLNLVPGVKRARLLYISRDSGQMLEYLIKGENDVYFIDTEKITELNFAGIISRWSVLESHLNTHILPPPDYKVWLNSDGKVMSVKQIKGIKYKSDWQALYDPYMSLIYENPQNYKIATYNFEFEEKGLL